MSSDNNKNIAAKYLIPRSSRALHYTAHEINKRLAWLEEFTNTSYKYLQDTIIKPEILGGNIENYIGAVHVPVGLAGPVFIKGKYTDGYVPVPIATTEGALISSICRGATACNLAGGIDVYVSRQYMLRAPVFFCKDLKSAVNLKEWVEENYLKIKKKAESVSFYAALQKVDAIIFGDTLHLKFYYTTGDAAGQNMTTVCTWTACEWILEKLKDNLKINIIKYNIEGNMSGDKKANVQNFLSGRGTSVTAYCYIPEDILKSVLNITPEQFLEGWQAGEVGASQIGISAPNINFANAIAGVFTATGQDIASVHESSIGVFKINLKGRGLAFSLNLPSLVIGTVGGGTHLPGQNECLKIMDCCGAGKVKRLAEIIAATCLALDISTGSAIVANEFVQAHENYGRNRPKIILNFSMLDEKFFQSMLFAKDTEVLNVVKEDFNEDSAIISRFTGKKHIYGLYRYKLNLKEEGAAKYISGILKIKAPDQKVLEVGTKMVKMTGDDILPGLYEVQSGIFNLENSAAREINFYKKISPQVLKFCPEIYGAQIDNKKELYTIFMQDLSKYQSFNLDDENYSFDEDLIKPVLDKMAKLHSIYIDRYQEIDQKIKIKKLSYKDFNKSHQLLLHLLEYNHSRYSELITGEIYKIYQNFLGNAKNYLNIMTDFTMTLVHGDFNPRNFFLQGKGEELKIILYDWELAFFQNPQRDLIEFLIYVMPEKTDKNIFNNYTAYYLLQLEKESGIIFDSAKFKEVLYLNAVYFGLVRLNLYLLANNVMRFKFLKRIYKNLSHYIINNECE